MKRSVLRPNRLTICLLSLLMAACGSVASRSVDDFTQAVYTPAYAAGFDIRTTEDNRLTLLTVRNAWQGAGDEEQHLVLLRDGQKASADGRLQAVRVPVRRVVCMSSSHVALFDAIGQIRRVAGVSGIDYISNPTIQAHRPCGEVRDVGYDTNLDYELLAAMRPDLVLLYGVTGESGVVTGKLRELGIPYLYVGDYMEDSPLGKAEWMVLAAELCDCREQGERIFAAIADRYEALKAQIASETAARPRVMLNTPYRDTWFMPSSRSYMIRLLEDAGGEYVYPQNDGNSSVAVDLEEAYLLARTAEVWINVGACNTLAELTAQNPKFARIPAVANGRVWNNNRRRTPAGGSDFWESGAVRPDAVLRDLSTLLRDAADSTVYYQRLR